jgi:mannose-6-phosphate isomerase-like protein (cupin superfamily)
VTSGDTTEIDAFTPLAIPHISTAARPVKLALRFSPAALAKWTPDLLRACIGSAEIPIEYSLSEMYRPHPSVNKGRYFRKTMPFGQALERILYGGHYAAHHYISALAVDRFAAELEPHLPQLRNGAGMPPMSRVLFIGNSKSGTHAHYDLPDNVHLVLAGEKRLSFFAPSYLDSLKPYSPPHTCCNFSSLADRDICELMQRKAGHDVYTIAVRPGEMVYIPSCWWHRVTSHGFTIAVANLWDALEAHTLRWPYRRFKMALEATGGGEADASG